MDWTNRAALIGGIGMILIAAFLVVFFVMQSSAGESDPFDKDETAQFLTDINDAETEIAIGSAAGIAVDGFIGFIVAACVLVLFRDRSNLLAVMAFGAFVANGAVSSIADAQGILLTVVADDFVNGGATGVAAGDPVTLEVGRLLGMSWYITQQIAGTPLSLALLALGSIITFAPAGAVNPPRFLGWIAILAGAAGIAAWGIVAADIFFIFFIISGLASLVLLLGLGGWLIMNRQLMPVKSPERLA